MSIGEQLRVARELKGMTQRELAEMVGVTPEYISLLESGKRPLSSRIKFKISKVLDLEDNNSSDNLRRVVTRGNAVVPLYRHFVKAGNGGHVLQDETEEFDVQKHYENTAVYVVSGDSMVEDDIESGDRLVVKLGYRFTPDGDTILCRYNGDLMVKHALISEGVIWLIPANKHQHPWPCGDSDELHVIGRVIEVIKDPKRDYLRRVDLSKYREG